MPLVSVRAEYQRRCFDNELDVLHLAVAMIYARLNPRLDETSGDVLDKDFVQRDKQVKEL